MISDNRLKLSEEITDKSLTEEDASHTLVAREISQEIIKFGVSQLTLKKVIEILALELEDRSTMLSVISAVRGNLSTSNSPIYSE
jgi:hypothetical protein